MLGDTSTLTLTVMWFAGLAALAVLLKAALRRVGVPAVVGHLALGLVLALGQWRWGLMPDQGREVLEFLGQLGIICLLFRVGLESDVRALVAQVRRAAGVWAGDVTASGLAGFAASYWLLGLALIPSLFVAVALMATSVGVSVAVWQEEDALDTPTGRLLVDVAEMDDISSIVLMALLFSLAPVLHAGGHVDVVEVLGSGALLLVKLALFAAGCWLFAHSVERRLTAGLQRLEPTPDRMISVLAVGILIAGLAGILGFSVAIGAFFAGLTFSRDPRAVKVEGAFASLYDLFTPFFFIHIGATVDPAGLGSALGVGGVLVAVAVLGKLVGAGGASLPLGASTAALVGVSMAPRAEIAMVVAEQGARMGEWAVPHSLFSALVLVSGVTCLLTPLAVRVLLRRVRP